MRGYVRQRGKSWAITVSAGFDPITGRRVQIHRSAPSKAEAEVELTKILRDLDQGTYADAGRITVGAFLLDHWLPHVRTQVRPRTFERYEGIVRGHLVPGLGSLKLRKLTPAHVQRFYTGALSAGRMDGKGGLSAKTVLHIHRVLSEALKHARRSRLIAFNVAEDVQPPRVERVQQTIVTPAMALEVLEAARGTDLEVATNRVMTDGDVTVLPAPPHDIHAVTALAPRTTTLLVARGPFSAVRRQYLPELGAYRELPAFEAAR